MKDNKMETGNLSQLVTLLGEGVSWYDVEPKIKPKLKHQASESFNATDELVVTLKQQAQQLLETEVARFEAQKSSKMSSDDKYLATMMKSGTLSDRVAALTLTIQASPLHSLLRLGQLITMASKKARRESLMAIDSLKDLFLNTLLPNEAKLRFFHQHPLRAALHSPGHLVLWFFEHCLKSVYTQLLNVLASGMDDAIDCHKRACLRTTNALLKAKPEQEVVLLAMLVNKLGDPDRKIAAYIHRMLQELLHDHPAMKRVVVDEVERLLTRSKVSDRAKYNAVLYLNQIYLESGGVDADLANHLILVYFGLFTKQVHNQDKVPKTKNEHKKTKKKHVPISNEAMDRKLLSALLVGVNRAFPYANTTSLQLRNEIDALFQVVHRAHHSTSVQALMLLFQVMNSTNSVSDRFYTALYHKLLDPKVRETSKHTLFLNLIFRAMKADVSPARVGAFMKRLLQVASSMTPAFVCGVLFLLSELLKVKPQLRTLLNQPEIGSGNGHDDDMEHFNDFKSEEVEHEDEEIENESEEGDDLVNETERSAKVLARMFENDKDSMSCQNNGVHLNSTKVQMGYDAKKRNPLYAGAEKACMWELLLFTHHYHPSVQSFTRQLIENEHQMGIQYAGDPLVDFTMHAFFEKFVNKKPRQKVLETKNLNGTKAKNWTFVPINTERVLETNVEASDEFFYKFFKERAIRETTHGKNRRKKSKNEKNEEALVDVEDNAEIDAFAQELAEGMMEDGDYDDEDPDVSGWSDLEDEDSKEDESDEEELEKDLDFSIMNADDEDQVLQEEMQSFDAKKKKQILPKSGEKRKGMFASADDYDRIVKDAMTKQKKGNKTKKGRRE
ncbi:putative CCAAT-binding factor [Plasmopara halstedii]